MNGAGIKLIHARIFIPHSSRCGLEVYGPVDGAKIKFIILVQWGNQTRGEQRAMNFRISSHIRVDSSRD